MGRANLERLDGSLALEDGELKPAPAANIHWHVATASVRTTNTLSNCPWLDRPTARLSGPIGLDGLFRKGAPKAYGVDAVKGSWLDDHTFVVARRILGHGETQQWTLAFAGKKVDVTFESTDGEKVNLHGEADE